MKKKFWGWLLTLIGLIIVFGTHGFLLADLNMVLGVTHAVLNIVAGVFILIGTIMISMR